MDNVLVSSLYITIFCLVRAQNGGTNFPYTWATPCTFGCTKPMVRLNLSIKIKVPLPLVFDSICLLVVKEVSIRYLGCLPRKNVTRMTIKTVARSTLLVIDLVTTVGSLIFLALACNANVQNFWLLNIELVPRGIRTFGYCPDIFVFQQRFFSLPRWRVQYCVHSNCF